MAPATQAKLSPIPPRDEPPASRINRNRHTDTAGLERLLLQLAETRAGSDDRLGSALGELRSRIDERSANADPAGHIESLEERIADLALLVRQSEEAEAGQQARAGFPDLDAQFRELNAALEASLNSPFTQNIPRVEADPSAGLAELQAIADRLQSIDDAVNAAGARSARIESIEAQLSELMEFIRGFEPRIEQVAQQAAVRVAFQFEEGQHASDATARLDAIQRDLQALTQRAGHMDERTLTTLETISGTLQRFAHRISVAGTATPGEAAAPCETGAAGEPARDQEPPEPGDSRRATKKPDDSRRATKKPDEAPIEQMHEDPEGLEAEAADPPPADDVEPDESGTVAIEPHSGPPRRLASDARKPRKILVFAAAVLLMVSAGLLYGRLNTRTAGAPGGQDQLAPTAPTAPAPADPAAPPANHEGSHAQKFEPGSGEPGAEDDEAEDREKPQRPTPKPDAIPSTWFDRASMVITDPVPGSGLVLKSQSH